jgi:hypothetical protein
MADDDGAGRRQSLIPAAPGLCFLQRGLRSLIVVRVAIDRAPLLAFTFEQGHLFLTLDVFDARLGYS